MASDWEWETGAYHEFWQGAEHVEIPGAYAIFRGPAFGVRQEFYTVFNIQEGPIQSTSAFKVGGAVFGTMETAKLWVEDQLNAALGKMSEESEIDWRPTDTMPEDYYGM